MLKLIPLGGLGEIGLNMMLVEYKTTIIIIDAGLMFPENYMLGIDYVIPKMDYLQDNIEKIKGLILTHSHEDHIGAVPFFLKKFNIPIFATAFTLEILRNKLQEHNIPFENLLYEIFPHKTIEIDLFKLEFIRVNHSVIDCVGIAIKTPVGTIIHTGDFKIGLNEKITERTDIQTFAKYGKQKLLALLSDSTNVEQEGTSASSTEITKELIKITEKVKGRIIIALFASNIARIQQLVNIAKLRKRKIVFNGRSLETSVNAAKKLQYIKIPSKMEINIKNITSLPDKKIMLITTGSQAEPMSSLSRMVTGTHKQISIRNGDMVILSSKFIPGNEKTIASMINNLYKQGANVVYEKIAKIHTSGHAFKEELKLIINLTDPKFFIPIHGEYRHLLLHSKLANESGIPKDRIILAQNGNVIELSQNDFKISERVAWGRILIDGKGIGDVEKGVLKERKILSEEGIVIVNITFDKKTGAIIYGPQIISRGFIFENKIGYLLNDAQCVILEIIEELTPEIPNRISKIKSKIQSLLRKYFLYTIGRNPIILALLLEI